MKKNKVTVIFLLLLVASVSSCVNTKTIPYVITEPECIIGKEDGVHDFAGIHFTFYNNSEKIIQSFKFRCLVFDSEGELNPLVGTNTIIARYEQNILSKDEHDVVFSLDSYILEVPSEPYIIDFFYVTTIEFSDGSTWKDPYGSWIQGGI